MNLDIELVRKLAEKEKSLSGNSPAPDTQKLKLNDSLEKHQEHYLKKRYRAAGTYFTLQHIFAYLLFGLVASWLVAVIITIFFTGFKFKEFELNNSVLIAFITSTTASVIGLFWLVANWLFGGGKELAQLEEVHSD